MVVRHTFQIPPGGEAFQPGQVLVVPDLLNVDANGPLRFVGARVPAVWQGSGGGSSGGRDDVVGVGVGRVASSPLACVMHVPVPRPADRLAALAVLGHGSEAGGGGAGVEFDETEAVLVDALVSCQGDVELASNWLHDRRGRLDGNDQLFRAVVAAAQGMGLAEMVTREQFQHFVDVRGPACTVNEIIDSLLQCVSESE